MACEYCPQWRRRRSTLPEARDHRACAGVLVEMARRFGTTEQRGASVDLRAGAPGLGMLSASVFPGASNAH